MSPSAVVVGAGIAGLTAARTLTDAGVECVVLEARDRIGGRLYTLDLAGTPVDLGGSWIHTPIGNPLREFAEQAGLTRHDGDPTGRFTGYDAGEARLLTADELDASMTLALETFPNALPQLRSQLPDDASMAEAMTTFLSRAGLTGAAERRAHQALRAIVEADAADAAERHSLRWFFNEQEYGGEFFGDLPAGGYRSIVDAMSTGVDVRLGVEVTGVAHSPDEVTVRTADGTSYDGSHVIVAVPLGVLRQGRPAFTPALPADRRAAIERLGFGRYEKVVLRYDRAFWRDLGRSHLVIHPPEPAEPAMWVFDHDDFGTGPVLECHLFHSSAHRALDSAAAQTWVRDLLAQAWGEPGPAPVAAAVTSWATDRWTGGAYTHVTPEASPADADLLGTPVGERLLFAGEHTQSARLGYADGAMSSGVRAAEQLLAAEGIGGGPRRT